MAQIFDTPSERSAKKFAALFLFNLGGPGLPLELPTLQSQSAGARGWTPVWTSKLGHPGHGMRLDLPVLDLREAHGNVLSYKCSTELSPGQTQVPKLKPQRKGHFSCLSYYA